MDVAETQTLRSKIYMPVLTMLRDSHGFIKHVWKDGEWDKGELVQEPYVILKPHSL